MVLGILATLVALIGLAAAAMGSYLGLLAVAGAFHRSSPSGAPARLRLAVLVPAHDESELISRTVAALREQDYPPELARVLVVADNCSDDTAARAAAAGAEVMVRVEPQARGKGQALRWAMDRLLAADSPPDAVVVVDADTVADPGLLRELASTCAGGAPAVQADYLPLVEAGRPGQELRALAVRLFNGARSRGREALGLPAGLLGNGMLFSRELLERQPWDAFSPAEDLEYSVSLRLAGVRARFTGAAAVHAPLADGGGASTTQSVRWEGGRFWVLRQSLPRLLAAAARKRDASLLEAALDLATPPIGLLGAILLAGTALAVELAYGGAPAPLAAWVLADLGLAVHVVVGARVAGVPASGYRALLGAPRFLLWKLAVYRRLLGGFDARRWERTGRPGESSATAPRSR